jgi:hypothetical protein
VKIGSHAPTMTLTAKKPANHLSAQRFVSELHELATT